jgi:hypothetical protein
VLKPILNFTIDNSIFLGEMCNVHAVFVGYLATGDTLNL